MHMELRRASHFRIVWSWNNLVNIQGKYILLKFCFECKINCQKLIEYNNNIFEKYDEEEKNQIDNEFIQQKTDPENNENAFDFR